jgi:hypothetical protein
VRAVTRLATFLNHTQKSTGLFCGTFPHAAPNSSTVHIFSQFLFEQSEDSGHISRQNESALEKYEKSAKKLLEFA